MKSIDKYVLVLVASLALLLAGCGGGGSSSIDQEADAAAAKQMRAEEQLTALATANGNLQSAVATLTAGLTDTDPATPTQAQIDNAGTLLDALEDALTAAVDVEDTSIYQTAVNNAMAEIATAGAARMAADDQAKKDRDQRVKGQMDAIVKANSDLQKAMTKLAGDRTQANIDEARTALKALTDAITAAVDVDDKSMYQAAASAAMTAIDNADTALMADMKAKNDAEMAMVRKLFNGLKPLPSTLPTTPTAAQAANWALEGATLGVVTSTAVSVDPDGTDSDPSVTIRKTSTEVSNLYGWSGSDYVRKMDGTTDHVVIYSNAGSSSQPFNERHSGLLTRVGSTTGFEIAQTNLAAEASQSLIKGSAFSTSGQKSHTDGTADDTGVEIGISGTFDGVSGTYSCTQAGTTPCTSDFTAGGGVLLAGGWSFVPGSLTAMTSREDVRYLRYGWWSRETSDGVDVAAFVSDTPTGTNAVLDGDVAANAISGKATYEGGAAGKYAVYNPLGENSGAGAFTAKATLEADFTNDKISGKITDFRSDGEAMGWSVSLDVGTAPNITDNGIGNSADDAAAASSTTTWTMDGVSGGDGKGSWEGNFYASNSDEAALTNTTPSSVAGEFTAMYDIGGLNIGQMVGAFGAETD